MNREIKFRGWDKIFKKWCEIPLGYKVKNLNYYTDYEWNQFIGLKDKNDVDIYEGDILDWNGNIGKVVFDNCAFRLDCPKYKLGYLDLGITIIKGQEECKPSVIGNVYENPELLK